MNGFIQVTRDEEETKLFSLRPTALLLLIIIAQRAKWSDDLPNKELSLGEAYIGDWKSYCNSERCYRTDKDFLKKHQKATFRTTNRGTIARIVSTSFLNIYPEKATGKVTDKRRASDEQATTNKHIYIRKNTYAKKLQNQNLSYEDLYAIAIKKNTTPKNVIKKYFEILELLNTGSFKTAWGKNLKLILPTWIKKDIESGKMEPMNEFEMLTVKDYAPGKPRGIDLWERALKAHKEGKL